MFGWTNGRREAGRAQSRHEVLPPRPPVARRWAQIERAGFRLSRSEELLQRCIAEAVRGASFYEVYDDVLRPSSLVDNGVATLTGEQGVLRKVPLRQGGAFVFNESTREWSVDRRPFLR
jgi:hypothetical protein